MSTIKQEVILKSVALMTGIESEARVCPSDKKGLRFHFDGKTIEANIDNVVSTEHCTVIGNNEIKVMLIEHFMAACAIRGIDALDVYFSSQCFEMPIFDGTAVAYKLQDIHDSMVFGSVQGESITGRMSYHQISKDAFFENPIFGIGKAGGHSKILDLLGCMGLLVFIPYFAIIWNTMKMQIRNISTQLAAAFIVCGYLAAAIYLYEKGIFGAPGYLIMIVVVPSIIKAFESEDF